MSPSNIFFTVSSKNWIRMWVSHWVFLVENLEKTKDVFVLLIRRLKRILEAEIYFYLSFEYYCVFSTVL